MRISDWSSDVCSSDLERVGRVARCRLARQRHACGGADLGQVAGADDPGGLLRAIHCPVLTVGSEGTPGERKSVVEGKSVSVRVDLDGRRIIKTKSQQILERPYGLTSTTNSKSA